MQLKMIYQSKMKCVIWGDLYYLNSFQQHIYNERTIAFFFDIYGFQARDIHSILLLVTCGSIHTIY